MSSVDPITFNGGDEVVLPMVFFDEDDVPVDLSGCTITGEVWQRGELLISLTEGSGIVIDDLDPGLPAEGEEQAPHITVSLTEAQTDALPLGRREYIKIIVVDTANVTRSTEPLYLEKLLR